MDDTKLEGPQQEGPQQEKAKDQEPQGVLFETRASMLQFLMKDGSVISFGRAKMYRATDQDEIDYLTQESKAKGSIVRIAKDQTKAVEPPRIPGTDLKLREQQLREFLAARSQGQGGPVIAQDSETNKSPIKVVSSTDSPLTGGTNPTPRAKQSEVIAALRGAKIQKDGAK